MELYRVIKQTAKKSLRACWISSFVAAMILFGAYCAVTLTESALMYAFLGEEIISPEYFFHRAPTVPELLVCGGTTLIFVLLIPVLCLGYMKLHYSFAGGKETSLSELFDYFASFKGYAKAICFSALLYLKTTLTYIISAVPGAALIYFAEFYFVADTRSLGIIRIALVCIGISLILLCALLANIFSQRWFVAPYYLAAGFSVHNAFRLSVKATKRRRGEIFLFKLSYIGWAFLSIFVFPIAWSVPYYSVSCAIYSKYLMEVNEHAEAKAKVTEPEPDGAQTENGAQSSDINADI